ncbi:EF-hand domain-containing protein [Rhizorhabdus argentea]|uniref:hypothetical protein n=1 Tax=Rhizorhabdus argentea TaxID=1387174 RepID=UPI0030EB94DB
MSKSLSLAAALLVGSVLLAAFGQRGPDGPPRTRAALRTQLTEYYDASDWDENGTLQWWEIQSRQERIAEEHAEGRDNLREWFMARFDADKDGSLSEAELAGEVRPYKAPVRPYGDDAIRNQAWHMVVSGDGPGIGTSRRWFRQADTNADGLLTRVEAARGPVGMFDHVDADHDGTISDQERLAARHAVSAG